MDEAELFWYEQEFIKAISSSNLICLREKAAKEGHETSEVFLLNEYWSAFSIKPKDKSCH